MNAAPPGATTRTGPASHEEEPAPSVECDLPSHRNPRPVPIDVDVEEAALGAAVLHRAAAEHVAAVRLDDWTTPERRAIAAAIRDLLADDGTPDPVLVAHRSGVDLDTVHQLFLETPSVSSAGHYCAIVTHLGRLRRIVLRAGALSEAALGQEHDDHLEQLLERLAEEVLG